MELHVREMRKADIPVVHRINERSFTTDAWSLESIEREFTLPYSLKFVLEKENEIVGYAVVWLIKEEAFLMTFAIAPEHRNRGLGKRLMEMVLEELRQRAKSVQLDVRKSNLPAIRLYRSVGFKIVRERAKFYSDGESALVMEMELV